MTDQWQGGIFLHAWSHMIYFFMLHLCGTYPNNQCLRLSSWQQGGRITCLRSQACWKGLVRGEFSTEKYHLSCCSLCSGSQVPSGLQSIIHPSTGPQSSSQAVKEIRNTIAENESDNNVLILSDTLCDHGQL